MRYSYLSVFDKAFLSLSGVFFGGLIVLGLLDGIGQLRAEPAIVACRSQQMDAIRYTFRSTVTCVPFPTRQDTLSLRKAK